MLRLLTSAAIVTAGLTVSAKADPTFNAPVIPTADAGLISAMTALCHDSGIKLSPKAQVACVSEAFPTLAKDGKSFRNQGIGAEFNTLLRQR